MECNGKCYLGKQLAKEAGDEDNNPFNKASNTEIPQFIISENISEFNLSADFEISNLNNFDFAADFYRSPYTLEILHPPQLG